MVLRNIRSYAKSEAVFDFPTGLSVLYGKNGIGKTTVLESIHLLTALKSFRTSSLAQMISFGSDQGSVEAKFQTPDHSRKVELFARTRKIYRDHEKQTRVEDFFIGERVVCLAPEHQEIIQGSPQHRRSYMDTLLFGMDPSFLTVSRRYHRALKQKAALLKQGLAKHAYFDLVAPWEQELLQTDPLIREKRIALVDTLAPTVQSLYQTISNSEDTTNILYEHDEKTLQDELRQKKEAEYFSQRVLTGSHRDDMGLLLREQPAKEIASQGEKSSLLLSLKIAEMQCLEKIQGKSPILLLDDVGGTLDESRKNKLFAWLTGQTDQQTILTTADKNLFEMVRALGAKQLTPQAFQ